MTDQHAPEPHEDDLLLDAVDGDPEATARVAADPRLADRLDDMVRARDALRGAVVEIDPAVRSASIAAALDVFDDLHASAAAATRVEELTNPRRATRWLSGWAGALAATAAVVVGIVAIGPNLRDSTDDSGGDLATAEAEVDEAATERSADAAADARPSSAPPEAEAAPAAASSATASDSEFTTTTIAAATTAAPADDGAGDDSADDGTTEEPRTEAGRPSIDERLLECAEQHTAEVDPDELRLSAWIGAEPEPFRSSEPPLEAWVVLLDTGFELDVVVDAETCAFAEIGDPRAPGTARP